ncbi:hypothetical protein NX801_22455 [Streptomyces sp. LP05-1]|uniref:SGNH hydrolase-type esterase domain-containing protein n=1 Tax=Streptomyces pyxinae TaxID=2970734 RepID=A0ABT2CLR3_9ACTN|nr:hypothetical protein [Streptomyces sp. LP05-1]MCS0638365.1 hypothetical protein [Streptomyces sp. LP05-1]
MAEEHDPGCLGPGEANRLLAGARWRRVVILGDGGTERRPERVDGYGRAPWYGRVADALREVEPGLACLNLLSGRVRRAADVRSRQLPEALAFGGDLAVLRLAGHELLRPAFDAGAFRTELVRIIAPLREHGCDVLLVDPFDLTGSAAARELDAELVRARQRAQTERSRTLAQLHGAVHVDPLGIPEAAPPAAPGVWSGTGLAPNGRGHAVLAAAVIRALAARLRPAPGPQPMDGPPDGGPRR